MWAGFVFGPLVGGFLVDTIGFRPAMLTCAGLTAVGLAVAVVTLPETARSANADTQGELRATLNLRRYLSDPRRWGRNLLRADHSLATVLWLFLIGQLRPQATSVAWPRPSWL